MHRLRAFVLLLLTSLRKYAGTGNWAWLILAMQPYIVRPLEHQLARPTSPPRRCWPSSEQCVLPVVAGSKKSLT